MIKVINILSHEPQEIIYHYENPDLYKDRFPETDYMRVDEKINWVGFFKNDWHHKWGKYIRDVDSEIEMECWRPYGNNITKSYSLIVDGILHKIFPSKINKIKKYGTISSSRKMLEELNDYIGIYPGKLIIHFYGTHTSLSTWLLNKTNWRGTPIIVQQLGGWFPYFDFKENPKNILKLIRQIPEISALKNISIYLTSSKTEHSYLKRKMNSLRTELLFNGIDINIFKPIERFEAKVSIGVEPDQKIILYVGRLNSTKNVSILIDAYNIIRKSRGDVKLYLVGCYENDEYFQHAVDAGALIFKRTDAPINVFYAAADVYVMPIKNPLVREFGGIGVAPLEALFMNTPVISENLKHCKCKEEELKYLGIYNPDYSNLHKDILQVLNNPGNYRDCRSIVEKHYIIQENSKYISGIYKSLIS